ncbi:MAG TPA: alkaline phosphatase family protein, partial [Verrucomicrobiae bacterium]|nr:alkaline phosphatase family protein [Verrucomicrobiae bacterium]
MAWKDEIQHVVVLMLENQSFDRMLGFLRLDDASQRIDGLTGAETLPAALGEPGRLVRLERGTAPALYVTDPTPGHQFEDITVQVFGQERVPAPATPTMSGFVDNYARQEGSDGKPIGSERAAAGLACLDPSLVPVISTLARSFVVCDRWFSSAPGPTWPNRFFVHAATSNGYIDSPTDLEALSGFLATRFRMRTIYENLAAAGRTWAVYFGDHAQAFGLSTLHRYASDNFRRLEAFAAEVGAGTLPHYSFLEPTYMDAPGTPASDQHPPHHLLDGERLIAWVYDTLRGNEAVWRKSLLVVLYDEHGGFFDHVPPPAAVPPDDASAAGPRFKFDRLGVRVPALLVSPWVGKGRVDHQVYDHTSLLATVKTLFGLPAFLTRRDARANTLADGNFVSTPRPL